MYNDMFKGFSEQVQAGMKPWVELNSAVVKQVETLTAAQLDSAKFYSEIGLTQLKQLSEIQSPADISQLGAKQVELAKEIQARVQADTQKLVEINKDLKAAYESAAKAAV
ncbi:phasin family protein [Thalassotalea ponticola]|uniref:phasin family protein n=1 Tax=Thalassotalea ponticola TaxID=1523392 RepID=UPI0025B3ADA9|nr:phasin family protein [Thalassotalea ponticola]MDN3652364.1 phasin family protein [Thalassotalea ponticola]